MITKKCNDKKFSTKDVLNEAIEKVLARLNSIKIGSNRNMSKPLTDAKRAEYEEAFSKWMTMGFTIIALKTPEKLDEIYSLLEDDESKKTFKWLIKYRVAYSLLANEANTMFMFPNAKNYCRIFDQNKEIEEIGEGLFKVNKYKIISAEDEVHDTWKVEQYRLEGKCEPEPGDVVISAGAFYGETSIWFAHNVGVAGKVYAFEPMEKASAIMCQNLISNKMENIIQYIKKGLWHENKSLYLNMESTSSFCSEADGDIKIETITLDNFVENMGLDKIDFIKMDIEGAELNALKGAQKTIKRFKPKLAICVYHTPEDIIDIPLYIKSLVPGYKIYLSHKTMHWADTILFAKV